MLTFIGMHLFVTVLWGCRKICLSQSIGTISEIRRQSFSFKCQVQLQLDRGSKHYMQVLNYSLAEKLCTKTMLLQKRAEGGHRLTWVEYEWIQVRMSCILNEWCTCFFDLRCWWCAILSRKFVLATFMSMCVCVCRAVPPGIAEIVNMNSTSSMCKIAALPLALFTSPYQAYKRLADLKVEKNFQAFVCWHLLCNWHTGFVQKSTHSTATGGSSTSTGQLATRVNPLWNVLHKRPN